MFVNFSWLILSYVLGSVPFGFLISKFSGKNVLEIGWKKTSGSNVFKNVGKGQGILTGVLDIAKGYLAVYGAQKIGLSFELQVFSGLLAVIGNNWSVFLKFAGGRGIGTFVGAFLALSPQILFLSIIPLFVLAIVWNAAIGTLLFLATAIFLSFYFNQTPYQYFGIGSQFGIAGIFTILSLAPILIKRLSPIKECKNNFVLARNRLFFDNDQALFGLRIKRLLKKEKENPGLITKMVKPLAIPVVVPSKVGWKMAKFGIKIAKKPIEKLIFKNSEKPVTEIRAEDLKKLFLAAAKKIVLHQEEINRINVFPVADKDTGYNLAATLLGVEGTIASKNYLTLQELTEDIKTAAMINARGNAGMIYTGYIIEVLDRIKHLKSITAFHLSFAMKKGIKAARLSITEPVEGTILDVIEAAGDKAYETAKLTKEKNIIKVLEEAYKNSEIALKETKEKLLVLKENNVVDAGALGFVKILEAWVENLKGVTSVSKPEIIGPISEPGNKEKLKYRYEVVLSFRKTQGTEKEKLKEELAPLGNSLDIIELEGKIKLHIHTNEPAAVIERFKDFPELETRTEDMEKQLKKIKKKPLGLIVDETADLPKEFLEKYDIEEIPFTTKFPNGEIIVSKTEIYPKMREALKAGRPLPTTSAPCFKEFVSAFQKAFEKFEKILVITVCSKLSGTYSSARIARSIFKKPKKLNIFVFDSFTAETAEGLVAVKTQELISQGKKMEEVVNELKKFCPKVTLLAGLDDFRYVAQGGRVKLPKFLIKPISLIQKIRIRPLVALRQGKIKFLGIRFGKDLAKILAEEVDKQRKGIEITAAIAHADNLKAAENLKKELEKKSNIKVLFVSSVSPVVATHTGPGALLIAFYLLDD